MDEHNPKKPLRTATNRIKDIYSTYVKNESGRIPPTPPTEEPKTENEEAQEKVIKEETKEVELQLKSEEIEKLHKEVDELKSQVEALLKEKQDLHEQLLRVAAEFENFRRRTQKEKEELVKYANEKLLFEFLTILDDLTNAVEASKQTKDFDSLATGVEMILQKAKKVFESAGVTEIESPVGKEFDYNYHEALMTLPSDLPEGYVVKELQKGYKFFDRVLRHTKVITSSGPSEGDGQEKRQNVE